jgi:hypothetical protein
VTSDSRAAEAEVRKPDSLDTDGSFPRLARISNLIIATSAIVSLSILPFCLFTYGWRPDRYLINPLSPALYYMLITFAVVLLASLRFDAVWRVSIAIFLVLLGGGVFASEVFLTISSRTFDPRMGAARRLGVDFDARDKLDVIKELERRNESAVPNLNPANFLRRSADGTRRSQVSVRGVETLPLGGVANATTVYCNESGQYVIYKSDEHGFNNPNGVWNSAPLTVAAVGDSFTQGSCVASERNILGLIRRRYPATLNLGMVNNGPLTELATLKEYLPPLRPRVVLWFYYEGNDLEDLLNEKDTPALASYLTSPFQQGLLTEQSDIDTALRAYITEARPDSQNQMGAWTGRVGETVIPIVKLERFRQLVGLSSPGSHKEHPDVATQLELFRAILVDANQLVQAWGGTLYVVYLPEWLRYAYPTAASKYRDAVLSIIRKASIPLIDIHPVFNAQVDPLALFPFRNNGHYNNDGYQVVADTVLSSIKVDDYTWHHAGRASAH